MITAFLSTHKPNLLIVISHRRSTHWDRIHKRKWKYSLHVNTSIPIPVLAIPKPPILQYYQYQYHQYRSKPRRNTKYWYCDMPSWFSRSSPSACDPRAMSGSRWWVTSPRSFPRHWQWSSSFSLRNSIERNSTNQSNNYRVRSRDALLNVRQCVSSWFT